MQLLFAILIAVTIIGIVVMLIEKKIVREFIRRYEENITIYEIFYSVLENAVKEKCEFFESSSIKFIENVEVEPILIQVDRYTMMIWKQTKVAGVVYELERLFNELADYSEKISDMVEEFEELKSRQDDIFKKLYHIRLLRLNLPQD